MASYKKNLEEVAEHLQDNEEIKYSVFGAFMSKRWRNRGVMNGIFVATNSRLVFFSKSHYYGYDLESFPFETISSIEMTKKMIGHKIKLFSSGNSVSLKWINKGDAQQFTEYVNSMIC